MELGNQMLGSGFAFALPTDALLSILDVLLSEDGRPPQLT